MIIREGSPPHLRGKRIIFAFKVPDVRITPAPAGKTSTGSILILIPADHPRTCGENLDSLSTEMPVVGSPPHLRGKPCYKLMRCYKCRITPAPAGKTTTSYWYMKMT